MRDMQAKVQAVETNRCDTLPNFYRQKPSVGRKRGKSPKNGYIGRSPEMTPTGQSSEIKHIILKDTREQKGLEFDHPDIMFTKKTKLEVGDYCIQFSDDYIPPVIFERKGLGDLFGTLTGDYDRFKAEVERANKAGITLILIIESSLTHVLKGYTHKDPRNPGSNVTMDGLRIVRTLFSLYVRYGVIPVFCRDRDEMSIYIIEYYLALWRKRVGRKLKRSL